MIKTRLVRRSIILISGSDDHNAYYHFRQKDVHVDDKVRIKRAVRQFKKDMKKIGIKLKIKDAFINYSFNRFAVIISFETKKYGFEYKNKLDKLKKVTTGVLNEESR